MSARRSNRNVGTNESLVNNIWVKINERFAQLYADFKGSTAAISHQLGLINTNVAILFNTECTDDKTSDVSYVSIRADRARLLETMYKRSRDDFIQLYKFALVYKDLEDVEKKILVLDAVSRRFQA